MLTAANLVAFVATRDLDRSQAFYEGVLGLRLIDRDQGTLLFEPRGAPLRVTLVDELTPATHTVLGWLVADAPRTARDLDGRGIELERFAGLDQDELGVWEAPDGVRVAWFSDPDGNLLSITEA